MNPCGITAGPGVAEPGDGAGDAAAASSSRMRRTGDVARAEHRLDHLAGGDAGRKRQRLLDDQPASQQRRDEDAQHADGDRRTGTSATLEKCMPISASAGIGPTTPVTKLMTAADDAAVCVMLFSSAP